MSFLELRNMKKRKVILLGLLGLTLFLGIETYADYNGSLELNQNILTNSEGGVGTTGDFPIRNTLFTDEMNQTVKAKMQDQIPAHRKTLDFSQERVSQLYNRNTERISQKLFTNYQPQVLTRGNSSNNQVIRIWLWLLASLAIPLVILALYLGKQNAKRRLKKKR